MTSTEQPPMRLLRDPDEPGKVLVEITPPQSAGAKPTKGCYCFVVDCSGSMQSPADVKSDDGDKVSLGYSQLDIGKHATSTFISSLEDDDMVALVTYGSSAQLHLDWTRCDEAGRAHAIERVNQMSINGTTNLVAGIESGFARFGALPLPAEQLAGYGQHLLVCTDGMPDKKQDYAPQVEAEQAKLVASRGTEAARVNVTTIGLGNRLDSQLLLSMADQFLHMPDPGAVGPFMVNLLANARATATYDGVAANRATLVVKPALALASGRCPSASQPVWQRGAVALGWADGAVADGEARLAIGAVSYDQPRHFVLNLAAPLAEDVEISLEVNGRKWPRLVASATLAAAAAAAPLPRADELLLEAETLRLAAVDALHAAFDGPERGPAPIAALLARLAASPAADVPAVAALATTLKDECMVGLGEAGAREQWGEHYCRTLPLMLRAERRSNFRDACLQHFGKDAQGRDGLFAAQSDAAELAFATLAPPPPSLAPRERRSSSYAPPALLPAEYMRGGGCFAPQATVQVEGRGATRLDAVRAGDRVRTADGGSAAVRCVVLTPCAGGRAVLVKLPGSDLEITEWHPVLDAAAGRFRFPLLLGAPQVVKACAHVYNLVLDRYHVALVDGVGCVTLGHGIETDPVARHAYWGGAVLKDLARLDGWAEGRVVLPQARAAAQPSLFYQRDDVAARPTAPPPSKKGSGLDSFESTADSSPNEQPVPSCVAAC